MKAHLFVLGGPHVGRSFDIEGEAFLGRDPGCQVRVSGRGVSRKHARVYHDGLGWFVEDLGSRNGVKRNGASIEKVALEDHDELLLGELPLRFRLSEEERAPAIPDARPAVAPAPVSSPLSSDDVELEVEIELEEEIVLEGALDEGSAPGRAPGAPSPARRWQGAITREEPEQDDDGPPAEAPPSTLSSSERRRAEILAEGSGRGLLRGDLAQQPVWVRLVVSLVLIGALVGLVWLVYRTVTEVRGTL